MPHSLTQEAEGMSVYTQGISGPEYCTFFQWRTAQWDWTLEEPPSQRPVMCG
jgi:hypothetical protein